MGEHEIQIYRAVHPTTTGEHGIPPSHEDEEDDSAGASAGAALLEEEIAMDRFANLPPLLLTLVLPIEYPIRRPPILKTVHATNDWLPGSAVASMVKRIQEIWDEETGGSGVLWRTCDWIRSGEFLTDISLLRGGVIRCVF